MIIIELMRLEKAVDEEKNVIYADASVFVSVFREDRTDYSYIDLWMEIRWNLLMWYYEYLCFGFFNCVNNSGELYTVSIAF